MIELSKADLIRAGISKHADSKVQKQEEDLNISLPYGINTVIALLIKAVKIQPQTVMKIYEKHVVLTAEIEKVLGEDKPIFKRAGGDQYLALGLWDRYLTIFFAYDNKTKEATITTSYPSSQKQIKSYKRLMG